MTKKKTVINNEVIETKLDLDSAYQARDALAKFIYGNLFTWIVKKINAAISTNKPKTSSK
jgi:myosin-5